MRFYLTQDQLNLIQSDFRQQQPVTLEKWMDWSGLDMIDKFVEDNNQRTIDFDDHYHIEQLNELYGEVRRFLQ
jgi:hypothetical protein